MADSRSIPGLRINPAILLVPQPDHIRTVRTVLNSLDMSLDDDESVQNLEQAYRGNTRGRSKTRRPVCMVNMGKQVARKQLAHDLDPHSHTVHVGETTTHYDARFFGRRGHTNPSFGTSTMTMRYLPDPLFVVSVQYCVLLIVFIAARVPHRRPSTAGTRFPRDPSIAYHRCVRTNNP